MLGIRSRKRTIPFARRPFSIAAQVGSGRNWMQEMQAQCSIGPLRNGIRSTKSDEGLIPYLPDVPE